MDKWKGKVAVVTGASAGLGVAICKDLCKYDMIVVGMARRLDRMVTLQKDIKERLGKDFYPVKCDVTSEEDIQNAFNLVITKFGGVDVLVNNAGVAKFASLLEEKDLGRLRSVIETNLMGNVSCTKKAYQSMADRDVYGYIITISSVQGHAVPLIPGVRPHMNLYAPSKHALRALNDVIRHELNYFRKNKIRISTISPGAIDTEIYDAGLKGTGMTFGRVEGGSMTPEEVSEVVVFLLQTNSRIQIQDIIIRHVNQL